MGLSRSGCPVEISLQNRDYLDYVNLYEKTCPLWVGGTIPQAKSSRLCKCREREFNTVIYSCINSWLSGLGCDKSGTASPPPKRKTLLPLSCFCWGVFFIFVEIEMEAETGKFLNYCKEYNYNQQNNRHLCM